MKVPIDCYIMQGEYPLPENVVAKFAKNGGELCKNVFLLSKSIWLCSSITAHPLSDKSGLITTANGLRIACLGGIYDASIYSSAETAPVGLF